MNENSETSFKSHQMDFPQCPFNREQTLQVCLPLTSQNFINIVQFYNFIYMIMSSRTQKQKAKSKIPANVWMFYFIFLFFVFMMIKKQAGSLTFSLEDMRSMIVG